MRPKNTSKTAAAVGQVDGLKISEEFLNDAKFGWKVTNHVAILQQSWMDRLNDQITFEDKLLDWGYDSIERTAIYKWRKTTR